MEKHLLVFGGSGYIGSALCALALKENIPVVSISRRGKPKKKLPFQDNPLMTWVAADIFTETSWHDYFDQAYAVVNLIGIIAEKPQLNQTFAKTIFMANYQIVTVVSQQPNLPFLFMSANSGGPFISPHYLENKVRAEVFSKTLPNPVMIFKPGLVVSLSKPTSLIAGLGIYALSLIPVIGRSFRKIRPISRKKLVRSLLHASFNKTSQTLYPNDF